MTTNSAAPSPVSVDSDWIALVDAGRAAYGKQDDMRWLLGDIGATCERRYGLGSIRKLAGDIGMANHRTMYDYVTVAKFYPSQSSARAEYPTLTWSHYREAARVGDRIMAAVWLDSASDGSWPVAKLHEQIVGVVGKLRRWAFDAMPVEGNGTRVVLALPDFEAFWKAALHDGATCEVVVSYQPVKEVEREVVSE